MENPLPTGRDLHKSAHNRHLNLRDELVDFDFGPYKIHFQATIAEELLRIDKKETTETFGDLCKAFSEVCAEHNITYDPIDTFILVNDGLKNGISTKFQDEDNGSRYAEIIIPINDYKVHEYWKYTFLHELGHSWLSVGFSHDDKECGHEDLFIDLIAICTFRKILPPHKRVYREVRKHRSYFLTQESKRFLGKELYREILQDPEAYLGDLWRKIQSV